MTDSRPQYWNNDKELLAYIKKTPENTNPVFLPYPLWMRDYILHAPQNVNCQILDSLWSGGFMPSVKPADSYELVKALEESGKVFLRNKIIADRPIEVFGGLHTIRFGNELKATPECDWFLFIARDNANLKLYGNGTLSSQHTKAIPVTIAHGSHADIFGGNYRCSFEAGECVYATNGGTVNIYGGTFGMEEGEKIHPLLNVRNGEPVNSIRVYGGRFIGWNPETGDDAMGGNFVANGYGAVEVEPNVWEVKKVQK